MLTGKHLYWSLFLIKLQAFKLQRKYFPVFWEVFKKIYFEKYLLTAASAS